MRSSYRITLRSFAVVPVLLGALLGALLVTGACRSSLDDLSDAGDGGDRTDLTGRCDDPAVAARLPTCLATKTEDACVAAGGRWDRVGLSPLKYCICPTGQGACRCTRPSECLAGCSAPLAGGPNPGACSGVVEGRCEAQTPRAGCFCTFDEKGQATGICVD